MPYREPLIMMLSSPPWRRPVSEPNRWNLPAKSGQSAAQLWRIMAMVHGFPVPRFSYDSGMKKQIAIVEDEPALRENYAAALARHGYSIKTYGNRRTAMQAFNTHLPDLAIIDISLEDEAEGGFDLCRDLRALSAELPIIFLTARDSELDAVSGLRLGADDFLTKDVSLPHLAARVAALFRRIDALRRPDNAAEIVRRGALSIDGEKMQTTWNGAPVTPILDRVLDRARPRAQSRPCQKPSAADGRGQCGFGRQHHHLSHQARAPQISASGRRIRRHTDCVRNGLSLGRVSIRLQLLIVALTTLVLPWAGCQYARELETALRSSQEHSLLASAGTIANALSAQPQRVFQDASDSKPFSAASGDLYVYPLVTQPLLDGYREDWDVPAEPTALPTATGYHARLQAGATDRFLYLFIEVDDAHFDPQPHNGRPDTDHFDRVNLSLEGPNGRTSYFFATDAPGLIAAQTLAKNQDGAEQIALEPRIQAFWLQSSAGYHLEARIPLSFVGRHFWVEAIAGRGKGHAGLSLDSSDGGRLFFATAGLDALLESFIGDGTRATVIDANALKLGSAGNVFAKKRSETDEAEPIWYRYLLRVDTTDMPTLSSAPDHLSGDSVTAALQGHSHAQWVLRGRDSDMLLTAAAPIVIDGQLHGAVVLEQSADQLLALRDQALSRLFNLTFIATAAAVISMFAFATWISVRIGRLRTAADSAVGNDGRIRLKMPESSSADEIGALARGFENLLARLNEHAQYLRTLGGKLSHELRTPLTIVRSSLDNLESEGLRDDQSRYITRAREGTQRLQSILSALGAAARVEESIKQSERVNFDLRELLFSAVAAYRDGFPAAHFAADLPEGPCFARGAPDLMVQLLDKLIENAVDFSAPNGIITVRLERVQAHYSLQQAHYSLQVSNDGPLIPQALIGRLFESLFEQRRGRRRQAALWLGFIYRAADRRVSRRRRGPPPTGRTAAA